MQKRGELTAQMILAKTNIHPKLLSCSSKAFCKPEAGESQPFWTTFISSSTFLVTVSLETEQWEAAQRGTASLN